MIYPSVSAPPSCVAMFTTFFLSVREYISSGNANATMLEGVSGSCNVRECCAGMKLMRKSAKIEIV